MTYTIEIDESSLAGTAKALETLNPGRSSASHMRDMVRANMWDGSTSMGTAGWEATGFVRKGGDPNVLVVRFSVSAHTVNHWLDTLVGGGNEA